MTIVIPCLYGFSQKTQNKHHYYHMFANIYVLGTQTGKYPLCEETKTLLLLKYGFYACEDCLNFRINIFEQVRIARNCQGKKQTKTSLSKKAELSFATSAFQGKVSA